MECYFFLISPGNKKDRIVRDVYFPEQRATSASVHIDENVIIRTGKDLRERGFRILGWAHSHSVFHTFHSGTDDNNHISVLNEIASDNYVEIKNIKDMFKDKIQTNVDKNKIIISDKEKNMELILDISGKFKGNVIASKLNAPINVGFAYSLVVNSDKDLHPHCEVAIKEYCPLYLREKEVETYTVPINIIENDQYRAIIDTEKIKEEIKNKVSEFSSFFGDLSADRAERRHIRRYQRGYEMEDDSGVVYSRDEVEELLFKQREELELQSKYRVRSILRGILMASPFGTMYRWYKKWIITPQSQYYDLNDLPSLEEIEEEIKKSKEMEKRIKKSKQND